METEQPYEYILYIDEAGDDGLASVKPANPNGASEWLCIGGFLTRAADENNVVDWVKGLRETIDARQGPVLHFRKLSPTKRRTACKILAELEARAFVICSNKKNMEGHRNEKAAKKGGKQWFYNYCVRLLMERATDLVFRSSNKFFGEPRVLKVVFSQRGGHSYGQTKAYWEVLKAQASGGSTFLNKREIKHQVLRFSLVDYVPHYQNAGLQLADIVASAFYQAVDTSSPTFDVAGAKALLPIIALENGKASDYGVTLQPSTWKAQLTPQQQEIFQFYGYSFV